MEANNQLLQQFRIVLKSENLLEMHSADLVLDSDSDNYFDMFLSDIDKLDFTHLQSEIQDCLIGMKENFLDLENDSTLINPIQL